MYHPISRLVRNQTGTIKESGALLLLSLSPPITPKCAPDSSSVLSRSARRLFQAICQYISRGCEWRFCETTACSSPHREKWFPTEYRGPLADQLKCSTRLPALPPGSGSRGYA